jgi:hypothetical protein
MLGTLHCNADCVEQVATYFGSCLCAWCLHAGMETGTAAAAAGGSTTVVDMPLNSHPCTTTAALLQQKMKIAEVCMLLTYM